MSMSMRDASAPHAAPILSCPQTPDAPDAPKRPMCACVGWPVEMALVDREGGADALWRCVRCARTCVAPFPFARDVLAAAAA